MKPGRPPMARQQRKVPMIVMVNPAVKAYLKKAAEAQNLTMSEYTRQILDHFYRTR